MKTRLGQLEMRMIAYLQMRKQEVVRSGELMGPLRLTRIQERDLLSRMARGGMITRVRPSLYLVPRSLPLGGAWAPNEARAITTLMNDRGGRYQICGLNAFNRYGFSEQIPVRLYAYNNRISGDRKVGGLEITFIKVADARLGDTDEARTSVGDVAIFSSRVRTLVDAVYDWARFGTLPRAYRWIVRDLKDKNVTAAELVRVTLRYGDIGTIRRMGALLEREGVEEKLLRKLDRALRPTTAFIPWVPRRPKRGKLDRRWGVVWNAQE